MEILLKASLKGNTTESSLLDGAIYSLSHPLAFYDITTFLLGNGMRPDYEVGDHHITGFPPNCLMIDVCVKDVVLFHLNEIHTRILAHWVTASFGNYLKVDNK